MTQWSWASLQIPYHKQSGRRFRRTFAPRRGAVEPQLLLVLAMCFLIFKDLSHNNILVSTSWYIYPPGNEKKYPTFKDTFGKKEIIDSSWCRLLKEFGCDRSQEIGNYWQLLLTIEHRIWIDTSEINQWVIRIGPERVTLWCVFFILVLCFLLCLPLKLDHFLPKTPWQIP